LFLYSVFILILDIMSFLLVLLIIPHYPLDKRLSSVYIVLGLICVRYVKKQSNTRTGCPFGFNWC